MVNKLFKQNEAQIKKLAKRLDRAELSYRKVETPDLMTVPESTTGKLSGASKNVGGMHQLDREVVKLCEENSKAIESLRKLYLDVAKNVSSHGDRIMIK